MTMNAKTIYVLLSIVGAVVPAAAFLPWIVAHGLNIPLMVQELFSNRVSAFFGFDVIVSAVVVAVFAWIEHTRAKAAFWWAPIAAVLCVGVSFGLPLLLYLREREQEREKLAL
jgi:hypothetical protein